MLRKFLIDVYLIILFTEGKKRELSNYNVKYFIWRELEDFIGKLQIQKREIYRCERFYFGKHQRARCFSK